VFHLIRAQHGTVHEFGDEFVKGLVAEAVIGHQPGAASARPNVLNKFPGADLSCCHRRYCHISSNSRTASRSSIAWAQAVNSVSRRIIGVRLAVDFHGLWSERTEVKVKPL
jgi:hypothetical protein